MARLVWRAKLVTELLAGEMTEIEVVPSALAPRVSFSTSSMRIGRRRQGLADGLRGMWLGDCLRAA